MSRLHPVTWPPGTSPAASPASQSTVKNPYDWLLAQYDTTDIEELLDIRPPHVQPMFTLKSVSDPGDPMRVRPTDYQDLGRWWL